MQSGEYIEIRPDIIIHKRTRLEELVPHLIVIEAKKYSNNIKDCNHVRDIMCDGNYRYKYGLLISYYENIEGVNCELLLLQEGEFVSKKFTVKKPTN